MAIKLLTVLFDFNIGTIVRDLGYDIERRLVELNAATYDLSEGTPATVPTFNGGLTSIEQEILSLEGMLLSNRNDRLDGCYSSPFSGWAMYVDTQYNSSSPFQLLTDTPAELPNNAGYVINDQLPQGDRFYHPTLPSMGDSAGDAFMATINFKAKPTNASTTLIEFWFQIEGDSTHRYKTPYTFPGGVNIERQVTPTALVTISAAWAGSRARFYVKANGPCNVYDVNYAFARVHRARKSL